jgi:hypothetical protein
MKYQPARKRKLTPCKVISGLSLRLERATGPDSRKGDNVADVDPVGVLYDVKYFA